ncbi:TetR/AcrR family transcriptional regulator [Nonomuraea gerenzanensis]|uniref:Transcriptional regulator, TetR family n=1 Tax=Nonomuraea gerenzanensis TaxID=93944 RepID=A0A1M4EAD5_9ACTN|nr:TetR/AcrR family transcriptional regulator [Nonomuraea gerenzanensis]UBU17919.1 TetR family transcriptional regulator [Nonomuraea gerenzanensis]SBO95714.1 Transcriptional regulator, TetR family [Nonomuraea gerenzanensis]
MPRASRADAERHRAQVIEAAAKLVRAHGAGNVSVPQAMAAAGLTHGGFYRHFASKDDLIAQACSAAFAERVRALDDLAADAGADTGDVAGADTADTADTADAGDDAGTTARAAFLSGYLSASHRDNAALGCPGASLAVDAARTEPGDPLRRAFTDGLRELIGAMRQLDEGADEETVIVELSAMVGALMLARACAGDELSDEILGVVRRHLLGGQAAPA